MITQCIMSARFKFSSMKTQFTLQLSIACLMMALLQTANAPLGMAQEIQPKQYPTDFNTVSSMSIITESGLYAATSGTNTFISSLLDYSDEISETFSSADLEEKNAIQLARQDAMSYLRDGLVSEYLLHVAERQIARCQRLKFWSCAIWELDLIALMIIQQNN